MERRAFLASLPVAAAAVALAKPAPRVWQTPRLMVDPGARHFIRGLNARIAENVYYGRPTWREVAPQIAKLLKERA